MNSKRVNWMFLTVILVHFGVVFLFALAGPYLPIGIVANLLISQAIVLGPGLLFLLLSKEKPKQILRLNRIKISTVLMIILFTFLMMPLTTVINAISMLFVENEVAAMSTYVVEIPWYIMVLVIGVIGPFSEELVFRGIVLNGYRKSANPVRAVLFSALLFGLMHLNFNQAAYAVVLGVVMAVLVEATGSLFGSVVFHITVNTASVIQMFLADQIYTDESMMEAQALVQDKTILLSTIGVYSVVATITTAIALCVLAWIAKNEKKDRYLKDLWAARKLNKGKILSIPLAAAFVLCFAFMILDLILY